MRISDWSSDVCSSDLSAARSNGRHGAPGSREVIVSAGGGAVGAALLRCALAARPLSTLAETPWRLLNGSTVPEAEFRAIEIGEASLGKDWGSKCRHRWYPYF